MTTNLHSDVEALHEVLNGNAVYSHGTVTFGTWADGGNVSMILTDGGRAHNKLIIGATGSGKTGLLESLRKGVSRAGVDVHLASPLRPGSMTAVADTLTLIEARDRDCAGRGLARWDGPMRLLLVDDLTGASPVEVDMLASVAKMGPKTNVAVLAASQDVSAWTPGWALLRECLTAGGLIEFRASYGEILPQFADGSTTAGVGLINGDLFRAWWPGN